MDKEEIEICQDKEGGSFCPCVFSCFPCVTLFVGNWFMECVLVIETLLNK